MNRGHRLNTLSRHLNYIAHPVIGDKQQGDNRNNRFFAETFGCRELLQKANVNVGELERND